MGEWQISQNAEQDPNHHCNPQPTRVHNSLLTFPALNEKASGGEAAKGHGNNEERIQMQCSQDMAMKQLVTSAQRPATRAEQAGNLMKKTVWIKWITPRLKEEKNQARGNNHDYREKDSDAARQKKMSTRSS